MEIAIGECEKGILGWGVSTCDLDKVHPRLLSLGWRGPRQGAQGFRVGGEKSKQGRR